jgi:hypothetical protein
MTASAGITVVGVKETLRELSKLEPDLRKEIVKDFKQIVKPVIDEVRGNLPTEPPLSGFARSWKGGAIFPWGTTTVSKSIAAKVDTRKRGNSLAVLKVVLKSAGGTVADMAGKRGGSTPRGQIMIAELEKRFGRASRFMWPGYERRAQDVQDEIEKVADKIADATSRRLVS